MKVAREPAGLLANIKADAFAADKLSSHQQSCAIDNLMGHCACHFEFKFFLIIFKILILWIENPVDL